MPKVPVSNVVQMPQAQPKVDPTMLAMAGALMHSEGKLTPLPKPDPRGSTFIERLPGNTEESGAYINAASFMRSKGQTTIDRVISPEEVMGAWINRHYNQDKLSVWGEAPQKRI